jgi:hypothetical protein
MTEYPDFKDKRGRTWEMFIDRSYFDLICVRIVGEKDFNSQLSFHFDTSVEALAFAELLKKSR